MNQTRREFLVTTAVAGVALSLPLDARAAHAEREAVLFDARPDEPRRSRSFDDLRRLSGEEIDHA